MIQNLYRERAEVRAKIIELESHKSLAAAALQAQREGKNDGERKALVAVLQSEGEAGLVTEKLIKARAEMARIEGEIEAQQEARRAFEWEIRRQMVEALQNRGYGNHDRDMHQAIEDTPLFDAAEDELPF